MGEREWSTVSKVADRSREGLETIRFRHGEVIGDLTRAVSIEDRGRKTQITMNFRGKGKRKYGDTYRSLF